MKRIIIITIISLLIFQFGIDLLLSQFRMLNYYQFTIIHLLLTSVIVMNYFNELYKSKLSYWRMILIAFLIPVVLYNFKHLFNFIYFNYTEYGQLMLKKILPPSDYAMDSEANILGLSSYRSPFEYSFIDSLSIYKISYFYSSEQYYIIFLIIISSPIILLSFFSRYQIFKKLNLNPWLSLLIPFNYFLLIDKFQLPQCWKIYLFLPIINIIFMYRINSRVVKLYNLTNSIALGLLFLPFIFYPKMAFKKKDFSQ